MSANVAFGVRDIRLCRLCTSSIQKTDELQKSITTDNKQYLQEFTLQKTNPTARYII
jgi:hypothetical protein